MNPCFSVAQSPKIILRHLGFGNEILRRANIENAHALAYRALARKENHELESLADRIVQELAAHDHGVKAKFQEEYERTLGDLKEIRLGKFCPTPAPRLTAVGVTIQ